MLDLNQQVKLSSPTNTTICIAKRCVYYVMHLKSEKVTLIIVTCEITKVSPEEGFRNNLQQYIFSPLNLIVYRK